MQHRKLGRSGLSISAIAVGCNNFGSRLDYQAASRVVQAALDHGINFFDTAGIYGSGGLSEEFLGKALGGNRDRVIIATKFGGEMGAGPMNKGTSRRYIMRAVEASLRRLGTGYIDLYQLHFPDPTTPFEETMSALDDLVHQGKVRYLGHSNLAGWQVAQCHYIAEIHHLSPFITAQNHYNLLDRGIERELVPACEAFGLSVLPYFPLASGLLTGKYRKGKGLPEGTRIASSVQAQQRYLNERNWDIIERLAQLAERAHIGMTELTVSWLLSRPFIGSVIAGAMTSQQVADNVRAAEAKLSPELLAEVDAATTPTAA
jgi:aryl-alcohol dehydrogenase-like predicted oxidoreductase